MTDSSRPWTAADGWIALGLFAGLLVVNAALACPTIYVGDSGELVAAARQLGIPHPSGYPLYVMLGKLWTLILPLGSVAWRMSLLSALCAAGASALVFAVVRAAGAGRLAAAFAGLLLAFGPSFWSQATVQRVYGLNALFVSGVTLLAVLWRRDGRPGALVAAFGMCGLGATNHTFMAVMAVVLALWAVAYDRSLLRRPALLVSCAGAGAAGLLPYLYLPLRSRADPRLDWGDPETLRGFLDVVLRREYWDRAWLEGPADLWPIAIDYLTSLGVELLFAGAALALLGTLAFRRHRLPVALPLLVMAANLAAMALHGSRLDLFVWHRYYIPSYLMAALLAGAGADVLIRRLPRRTAWILLLIPLAGAATGWRQADRSRYRVAEDFSRRVLASLPPGAHLIASDDNILFSLLYLQMVEGERPEVDLIAQGVGEELPPLRFHPTDDPLFLTHDPGWRMTGLEVVPVGVVFRAWRPGPPPPVPDIGGPWLEGEHDRRVPRDYLTRVLIGHFHYMLGVTLERADWPAARRQLDLASEAAFDNDVVHYNLGLIFRRNGLLSDSRQAFLRTAEINPRGLPGPARVRAADRLTEVEAEVERLEVIEKRLCVVDPELAGSERGTPGWHRRLAKVLEAQGENVAAGGHRLRAQELEAGPGD